MTIHGQLGQQRCKPKIRLFSLYPCALPFSAVRFVVSLSLPRTLFDRSSGRSCTYICGTSLLAAHAPLPTMHFSTLLSIAGFVNLCIAGYTLEDDFTASTFFSLFNFTTENDPTGGYVNYVSQSEAQGAGMINTNNGQVYMGVDHNNVASGRGRSSLRLESFKTYNHALVVLDLANMPGGICGTWPAFVCIYPASRIPTQSLRDIC